MTTALDSATARDNRMFHTCLWETRCATPPRRLGHRPRAEAASSRPGHGELDLGPRGGERGVRRARAERDGDDDDDNAALASSTDEAGFAAGRGRGREVARQAGRGAREAGGGSTPRGSRTEGDFWLSAGSNSNGSPFTVLSASWAAHH